MTKHPHHADRDDFLAHSTVQETRSVMGGETSGVGLGLRDNDNNLYNGAKTAVGEVLFLLSLSHLHLFILC